MAVRSRWISLLSLFVSVALLMGAPSAAQVVVPIPDPGLEAALRAALAKPSGDIFDTEIASLSTLDASSRGISNLSGLENATGLDELFLSDNLLTGIGPLAGLTNLGFLDLSGNPLAALDFTSLTGLEELLLMDAGLADLSSLQLPTSVDILDLSENAIVDVSPLASVTQSFNLSLRSNLIVDPSPLVAARIFDLDLSDNLITDPSLVPLIFQMCFLSLNDNPLSGVLDLSSLPLLESLDVARTGLTQDDLALPVDVAHLDLSGTGSRRSPASTASPISASWRSPTTRSRTSRSCRLSSCSRSST